MGLSPLLDAVYKLENDDPSLWGLFNWRRMRRSKLWQLAHRHSLQLPRDVAFPMSARVSYFQLMKPSVIVWDLETVPDLPGFAAANDLIGRRDADIREVLGNKFPKHIYHTIVCIGALVAHLERSR
jgi:hypothetical protein